MRQKLALFHASGVSAEEALGIKTSAITFDYLVSSGATALNATAAGVGFLKLKEMGMKTPELAREFGFDSLHLVDHVFCAEAVAAWSAHSVVDAFLVEARDAVALASPDAMATLGLTPARLLGACAGAPAEAKAVVDALGVECLKGLHVSMILDTGLRAVQLRQLGVGFGFVISHMRGNRHTVEKLGFAI